MALAYILYISFQNVVNKMKLNISRWSLVILYCIPHERRCCRRRFQYVRIFSLPRFWKIKGFHNHVCSYYETILIFVSYNCIIKYTRQSLTSTTCYSNYYNYYAAIYISSLKLIILFFYKKYINYLLLIKFRQNILTDKTLLYLRQPVLI